MIPKFVNDIDLADRDSESMMIMANGRTFSVTESGPKKLIMNTLARAAIERDRALDELAGEDQRLLMMQSPNTATLARQKKPRVVTASAVSSPQGTRPKVTFHDDEAIASSAVQSASNSPR